jgi:hypothetical protein
VKKPLRTFVALVIVFSAAFAVSASADEPVAPRVKFLGFCNDLIVRATRGTTHDTFPVYINGVKQGLAHGPGYSSPPGFQVAAGDVVEVYANPRLGDGGVVIATFTVMGCQLDPRSGSLAFTGASGWAARLGIAVGLFLLGLLLLAFIRRYEEEKVS